MRELTRSLGLRFPFSEIVVGLCFLSGSAAFQALYAQAQSGAPGEYSITLTGDSIIETSAEARQTDPGFMGVVKAIREGEVAFTNVEEIYPSRAAYPAAVSGNVYIAAPPTMLHELQWMGLNLFNAVNNHSLDYDIQGVLDTLNVFRKANAVYAGIGETLGEARAPNYLYTAHGRTAIIACTSTFLESAPAGDPRPDMQGRPGISALHHETIYHLDQASFSAMQKIKSDLQLGGGGGARGPGNPDVITFPTIAAGFDKYGPVTFKLGDKNEVTTRSDPDDLAAITHSIRDAKALADYVVTSIHAHEGVPGPDSGTVPAQFLVEFAHASVDAGTDVFVGHGPLQLRGIEIYKGKPIFYSMGMLFYQNELVKVLPHDFYDRFNLGPDARPSEAFAGVPYFKPQSKTDVHYRSVVARVIFHNGHPSRVILTPIQLSVGDPVGKLPDVGAPALASAEVGNEILEYLQKLSAPFGTKIDIQNGVGIIDIDASANH
jgi:poly-gamma-glutamate capsule biosynthesis protein CapA/YwtB (metallophosphatase superfamily)